MWEHSPQRRTHLSLSPCKSLSNPFTLGEDIVSPSRCFSTHFQSGLLRSAAAAEWMLTWAAGQKLKRKPTPVREHGNSNYILNNYPFAIISPSAYRCRQVQREGPAHTPYLTGKGIKWGYYVEKDGGRSTTCCCNINDKKVYSLICFEKWQIIMYSCCQCTVNQTVSPEWADRGIFWLKQWTNELTKVLDIYWCVFLGIIA